MPCPSHDVPHGAETATATTPDTTGATTAADSTHRAETAAVTGAGVPGGLLRRPGGEFHEHRAQAQEAVAQAVLHLREGGMDRR